MWAKGKGFTIFIFKFIESIKTTMLYLDEIIEERHPKESLKG